ncbi:MAG TPA: hypothetical protein VGN23_06230 [Verrucomicrobiae bacterium]|jgi:hypothetical protein
MSKPGQKRPVFEEGLALANDQMWTMQRLAFDLDASIHQMVLTKFAP